MSAVQMIVNGADRRLGRIHCRNALHHEAFHHEISHCDISHRDTYGDNGYLIKQTESLRMPVNGHDMLHYAHWSLQLKKPAGMREGSSVVYGSSFNV